MMYRSLRKHRPGAHSNNPAPDILIHAAFSERRSIPTPVRKLVGSRSPSCLKSLFFAWEGRLLVSLRGQPQAGRGNLGMRKSFVCKRLLRSARNDKRRLPFSWHKKNVLLWTLLRQFVPRDP